MPITFTCPCGQTLSADEEHAGLAVRCPACNQTPVVPHQLWDSPQHAPAAPGGKPWNKGADAEPVAPPRATGYDPARENPAQVKGGQSLEGKVFNSGVAGGALAMFGAVVWFVVGLAADIIFFYPPILFIIGLVAFCKGLMQGPEGGA